MTTFAKCRDYEKGFYPPLNYSVYRYQPLAGYPADQIDWDNETFMCWQPDELDNEEFNLILYCKKRKIIFLARSIDFDFNYDNKF